MSCHICSARRNIPFNQKQSNWAHTVMTDFKIFESMSMDLKVMPSSDRGYNYLLVMRCNNSRYIITTALKTRQAKEIVEAIFQNLICAHGTNINKTYCDLDTCFKNEIMDLMTKTLGIKVQFCIVESHQSNPAERSIQSIYIATYGNKWSFFNNCVEFCLNTLLIGHLNNISSYEMVFGRKPPVLSNLQLLNDNMTRPCNYNFADYLDLLNECFKSIRSIALGLHNEEVAKSNTAHSAGNPTLRDFHEVDIVYCILSFPI